MFHFDSQRNLRFPILRSCKSFLFVAFVAVSFTPALVFAPTALAARFVPMPPVFTTGGTPQQIAVADVNRDGVPDLITSNTNGVVSVLLGKGGGAFGAPITVASLSIGVAPYILLGDLNGDGNPDIALSSTSSSSVWIYLGHGDGAFSAPVRYATATSPAQIAAGDVNGDGRADIVAVTATGLSTLIGNGNGTFRTAINTTGTTGGTLLALGDLNGDGHLDAIVGRDDYLEFLGTGDGHFTQANTALSPPGPLVSQILLTDLDRDGKLDLVSAANVFDPIVFVAYVTVAWGVGDGTLTSALNLSAGHSAISLVAEDLNRDGKVDLAAASSYSNSVSVLINQGSRHFASAVSYRTAPLTVSTTPHPGLLATADLDGNGLKDLAVATLNGAQVLTSVATGQFFAPGGVEVYDGPTFGFAVPLNGDRHSDLAVEIHGRFGYGNVLSLFGDGTGRFPRSFNAPQFISVSGFGVGDFNGDGRLDFAYDDSGSGIPTISTLLNSGMNSFTGGPFIENTPGSKPVAGDLNNDGYSDLAVPDGSRIDVYLNDAHGGYKLPASYTAGTNVNDILVTDVNKDGKRDLVAVDNEGSQVAVLLGKGDGTFQAAQYIPMQEHPSGVVAGDFNRDGRPDLAVACEHAVEVLLGSETGNFAPAVIYSAPGNVASLHQASLRQDNKEDLLFTDGRSIVVMFGRGDGSFDPPIFYSSGINPTSFTIGDFNEDGAPDIAVMDSKSTALGLLLNLGGTRLSLTSSTGSVRAGQPVTFTATIAASVPGAGVPTGTVAFKDGPKGIGFVHLLNGRATFTTSQLSAGTHVVTASFWETSSFNPHVSAPVNETVVP